MDKNANAIAEIDIDRLTESELIDLNHRIVERLRFLDQMRAHGTMMKFRRGERVRFRDKRGEWVYGALAKYNQKTVAVISDHGQQWNVSPGFLESVTADNESAADKNVIEIAAARKK
ncbi:MAG: hypothetical protein KDD69_15450 [Bdellovibrionales bacterium]|nr:hypothetical protein [Bdellovibrionales bacterium]